MNFSPTLKEEHGAHFVTYTSSQFWLVSYILQELDSYFLLVYFSASNWILARQIILFFSILAGKVHHGAWWGDNSYNKILN